MATTEFGRLARQKMLRAEPGRPGHGHRDDEQGVAARRCQGNKKTTQWDEAAQWHRKRGVSSTLP